MPVLVVIQLSLVSKNVAKSSLVTVRDDNALPVPIIFILFSIKNKNSFSVSIKNVAKVPLRSMPRGKCVQNGTFVAKIGYLWRNLGFFVAKFPTKSKKRREKSRL